MFHEPISKIRPDVSESDGTGNSCESFAEALGITRFFGRTYVVGGLPYSSMAERRRAGPPLATPGCRPVSPRDAEQPAYFAVLTPLVGFAVLIWWLWMR